MDGRTLLRDLRILLQEQSTSTWLDTKTSYDYLYQAAIEFVSRTRIQTAKYPIVTVADQSDYKLPADFLQPQLYELNGELSPFIKYDDGTNHYFLRYREYDPVILSDNTTSVTIPDTWSVTDVSPDDNVTGSQTETDASQVNGEALLTDTSGLFTTTDVVSVGDAIHNTTDGSSGYVMEVVSGSELYAALFDGSENNWDQGDSYVITPQGKLKLVLDPPPATSGHTVWVYYVQRPAPVYSDFRKYRIPIDYKNALVFYACWLYKNRDREPNYADYEYKYFDEQVRKANVQYGKALNRKGFRVNFMKQGQESGSWR